MRNKHSYYTILILLLFVFASAASAQQKPDTITVWLESINKMKDDTNKINELHKLIHFCTYNDPQRGIQIANEALELAEKAKWDRGIHRAYTGIAKQYGSMGIYATSLEYFNKALTKAEAMHDTVFISTYLNNIGLLYSYANEPDKALEYYEKQAAFNKKNGIPSKSNDYLNLGHLYFVKNDIKTAEDCLLTALKLAEKEKNKFESLTRIYMNLADLYSIRKQQDVALQYFTKAEAEALQKGDKFTLAMVYYNMGCVHQILYKDVYSNMPDSLKNKTLNLQKMQYYFNKALAISREINSQENLQRAYLSLSEMYEGLGDAKQALAYRKQYELVTDSLRDIGKQKEFAQVEAEFKVQKTTDSLKYIATLKDEEVRQRKLERNGYVLLIALVGTVAVFLINRQKLKHIQKRKLAENLAKQQLTDFTNSIHEKNALIEQFSAEIEKYQALPCSNELAEKDSSLQTLLNAVILTDEQWVSFQSVFEKVHTGYIIRARNKFKDMTPAELRYLLLSKLGLTYKEMAATLGVSIDAVRITKHRLLKKIQLPEGVDFEQVVHSI